MFFAWKFVILLIGFTSVVTTSNGESAVCSKTISQQESTTVRVSGTRIVSTQRRCWLFWWCTEYRSEIAYRTAQRTSIIYLMTYDCCQGYMYSRDRQLCVRVTSDATQEPNLDVTANQEIDKLSVNRSKVVESTTADPYNLTSTNMVTNARMQSTSVHSIVSISQSLSSPARNISVEAGGLNSRQVPRGAVIMISLIAFFVMIVIGSIVLYRRRRRHRKQRSIDNLHMEPLRDLQLLSQPNAHIQHFSPPSAPSDEYAIVDKTQKNPGHSEPISKEFMNPGDEKTLDSEAMLSKPNGRREKTKSVLSTLAKKMKPNRTPNLTHTYMEGPVGVGDIDEDGRRESAMDSGYANSVVEGSNQEGCYTEVDDMGAATGQNSKSDPSQDTYENVAVMPEVPTYDHLDREPKQTAGDGAKRQDLGDRGKPVGKYEVLVKSSSVDTQEEYNALQRSLSQTNEVGNEGYGSLLTGKSSSSELAHRAASDTADTYDDLDRGVSFTSKSKGKALLGMLRESASGTVYGHLGSSIESDTDNESSDTLSGRLPDSEPIYLNQDVASGKAPADFASERDSCYTDMSGRNSRIRSQVESDQGETYTEMSPCHNNYDNVVPEAGDSVLDSARPANSDTHYYSTLLDGKQVDYDRIQIGSMLEGVPEDNPVGDEHSKNLEKSSNLIYENV